MRYSISLAALLLIISNLGIALGADDPERYREMGLELPKK